MLDWNMPVSGWQVILPPAIGAFVSVISVAAAYFIGRGAERRRQRDSILEANLTAMHKLFSKVNSLTSDLDRHIMRKQLPSSTTFDKTWNITTGISWVPGLRDAKLKRCVLQPTADGLIIDLWLRTRIHGFYMRMDQRDLTDEYNDHLLRTEVTKIHPRLQEWVIGRRPASWFLKDLSSTGYRFFHPLYGERQNELAPLNLDPESQKLIAASWARTD
ncbi:hypothetical protein [Arthrobacter globiformis]|uniref:hypothetical protein n=1 Tax=Arthrobacter globiformis TaxID=1665 RepID=UPI00278684C8|nr:hypothetical protein [Arthrobacter globiformis]MDQ0863805.1 hypothetical protein [Arthrobacter globiformis]